MDYFNNTHVWIKKKSKGFWLSAIFLVSIVVVASPSYAESINSVNYEAYAVDYWAQAYAPGAGTITYPYEAIYIVPKRSILLLHGDIVTPVNFMPDLPAIALSTGPQPIESGDVEFGPPSGVMTGVLPIPLADLNAENIMGYDGVYPVTSISLASTVELFSADFSGDGKSDILVSTGDQLYIISHAGAQPELYATIVPPAGYQITGVADENNDGLADIQFSSSGESYAFVNSGGGEFDVQNVVSGLNTSLLGAINGAFRVNEQGAATYDIPVMTFAGTAGVAPQVSLNYSSSGGSGIAGVGWSISGISAISRCRQTESQDGEGKSRPLSFTSEDRFCLDGQRLILTAGTYGSAGSTYRTEIDSAVEVTAVGGAAGHPDSFKVTRKDGSVSYYGVGANAKLQVSAGTLTWGINEFADSASNPIRFHYANDNDGFRVSRIDYAYDDNSGGVNASSGASIAFNYEDRPDIYIGYSSGDRLVQSKRLSSIDSTNDGQVLRTYYLSYLGLVPSQITNGNTSTTTEYLAAEKSFLQAIHECVGSKCLAPTTFDWQIKTQSTPSLHNPYDFTFTAQSDRVASWKPIDINGDGIGDLVWVVADYDTDGDVHDNFVYSMLGSVDGYHAPRLVYSKKLNHSDNSRPMTIEVLDFNADGRQDIALWDYNSWKIMLSTPQGSGGWELANTSNSLNTQITTGPSDVTDSGGRVIFSDINADGLVDVVYSSDPHLFTYVSRLVRDTTQGEGSSVFYRFEAPQPLTGDQLDLGLSLDISGK